MHRRHDTRRMAQALHDLVDPFGPSGPFQCRHPGLHRARVPARVLVRVRPAPWLTELLVLGRATVLPFIATRLSLLVVGLLATVYLRPVVGPPTPARLPAALWLMWQHFDSGFYLAIAMHGYGSVCWPETISAVV
jgi:hypothetical protein